MAPPASPRQDPRSLRDLAGYFLRLGTVGFGGPIALTRAMQRDLVQERRWVNESAFNEGLALAQLCPGPLAAQLAMYMGWALGATGGLIVAATAFIAPSFIMVVALGAAYVRFGGLPWMLAAFAGIGPAAIALVGRGAVKLARSTLKRDRVLWFLCVLNIVATAWSGTELISLVVASGLVPFALRGRMPKRATAALFPLVVLGAAPGLFVYFAGAGLFVFGSGLAIVPFLHGGVVQEHHWLTERQFIDAIAVSMITPGPVVITVAFIGYLVAGLGGATAAALGVFLPPLALTLLLAPRVRHWSANRNVRLFVDGVTAAATGALAGAVIVLARRTLIDIPALVTAVGAALLLVGTRIPEPILLPLAGVAGIVIHLQ